MNKIKYFESFSIIFIIIVFFLFLNVLTYNKLRSSLCHLQEPHTQFL
jgi:hypothetical protein